ncbi:MAG: tRNA (adenosine(37)-N6)-dimethylallyltransferase MiaA [Phycisphaerales bacterium]|nr:tRNA (adenosine(37)-N6)-dimethylallyltransferase MiaA [Phycisphaerales bacterium]
MEPVYFILGCTGCGKGALGREIARQTSGSILSVDSMKVYRRMNIGTNKPSAEIRAAIPHYGLDLVEPWETYSVADYVKHAHSAIADIRAAGSVPLLVGGTSLYIKALYDGLFEGPGSDEALRAELAARIATEGAEIVHAELAAVDPASAERIHPNDERRIIRALEVYRLAGKPLSELQTQWEANRPKLNAVRIGIRRERELQNRKTNARAKAMLEAGLVDEVRALYDDPQGLSETARLAVGYAELFPYFEGKTTLDKAIERIKINTRQLAKKQRTWHRRWADVQWFDVAEDDTAESVAARVLAKVEVR